MTQSNSDEPLLIEGYYNWGPGVVTSADCLGSSYQTSMAGRPMAVVMPAFDGGQIVEPPNRHHPGAKQMIRLTLSSAFGKVPLDDGRPATIS